MDISYIWLLIIVLIFMKKLGLNHGKIEITDTANQFLNTRI